MAVIRLAWNSFPPQDVQNAIVTIGNFDGVHCGHASLLATACRIAEQKKTKVVTVTFDPHPVQILTPDRYQLPLTTMDERARLLQQIGTDHVVFLHTTPELLALGPEAFFEDILIRALKAQGIVEGFNFRFGRNRQGSNRLLQEMCQTHSMVFQEVTSLEMDGEPVSTSRVREAVLAGEITTANHFLGHPYALEGVVRTGAKRGRTIGFPTANLEEIATILPTDGVYAVRAIWDEQAWPAAMNIGPNPTFEEQLKKIEVHLIGYHGNLYDQRLRIELLSRLRATMKFTNVDTLIEQMKKDLQQAIQVVQNYT